MNYYNLYGFQIETEEILPFPSTLRSSQRCKEVRIVRQKVPLHLDQPSREKALIQMCPGKMLITIPEMVRFLVEDGERLQFEPLDQTSVEEIVPFLLDTALVALIYQNGLMPLLGTAIADQKDQVMLILSEATCGKSTLGYLLSRKGFRLISDSCCALKFEENGEGLIQPGLPYMKLHRATLHKLGLEPKNYELIRDCIPIFKVPISPPDKELIIRKVFLIEDSHPLKTELELMRGKAKVARFNACIYLPSYWGSGKNHNISMDALFRFYNQVPFYNLRLSKFDNALFELPDLLVDVWENQ